MNVVVDNSNVELAARAPVSRAPIDVLPANMLSLSYNIYTLFRGVVLGGYAANGTGINVETAATLIKTYKDDLKSLNAEKLRNSMLVRPGDGKKPITISFTYDILALPKSALEGFTKVLGTGRKSNLLDAAEKASNSIESKELLGYLSEAIKALTEPVKAGYNTLDFYKEVMQVNVVMRSEPYAGFEDEYVNAYFEVTLSITADFYEKIVDSDTFSPYLVNMAANNLLNSSSNRAAIVIDPRKTATLTKQLTSKFGNAKPRVNADGFSAFINGIPIAIPKEADFTEELVRSGDSSLREDGVFDETILVAKNLHNRIIYVDWLNDILAYTSPTGKLDVISLIGTTVLTPDMEFAYLQTPITDTTIYPFFKTINESIGGVSVSEIEQYIDAGYKDKVPSLDAASTFAELHRRSSGLRKGEEITIANLCGFDFEGIEEPSTVNLIMLYKAYVKYLSETKKKDASILKIPSNFASQGVRFRLVGLEYFIFVISEKNAAKIELLRKEWKDEQLRKQTNPHHFNEKVALPNIKIGGNGLVGLLPHQSRIYSSMSKTPRLAVLPVMTGGGKSLLSILDALSGIRNNPGIRPVISTKGSLVKGLVTEINRVSQGALNPIPLRAGVLRRLRKYGIDTLEKLIKWVRALPPNTIFINAYSDYASRSKIYKEVPSIPGIGTKSVIDSQYLRIMRIISFQMTIGDESHLIKNPDSNRSRGAYSAFCSAEYRRVMSGTFVSNTVKDVVGQTNALSPLIFGNDSEKFCTKYNIEKGIIKDDATAALLKRQMLQYTAYHQATEDEWSFMLPAKQDEVIDVKLTQKQTEYYQKLMLAAYLELTGKKKLEDAEAEDVDDEEDDEDDEEEGDEAFVTQAKKVFAIVEQFLSAPDEDEEYIAQTEKPTGADLVSPKVPSADILIDKLLREGDDDPAKNKIIVFGINISAVRHFMRHSKHAKNAVVYYAGDFEALRQYSTDNSKRILVAAETSIREGENLQMTRAIIKLQVPWAPGDYIQALARMYRPDPRGKYNRDSVNHYVLSAVKNDGEVTLDGCKMARLISKFVSNARLTYENDINWMRISKNFEDLGLVTMNLDFIFNSKSADLRSYFGGWQQYVQFEALMNKTKRSELAKTIEASTGEKLLDADGKVQDVQKFLKFAMTDVEAAAPIPGSKSVYVPWIIGGLPADPDNLGYEILGSQPVHEGDVVLTEFGPGIVRRVSPRTVKVETYGGKLTGFRRTMVCVVPDVNKHKLEAIVKDGKKWQAAAKDPFGKVGTTALRGAMSPVRDNEPEPPKTTKAKKEPPKPTVDVNTVILNGMPALVIMNEDNEELDGLNRIGWKRVDPYISISFRTWAALSNFLDQLETKAYIPPKVLTALEGEIEEFKHGSATKLLRQITPSKVRQFFEMQNKKFGKKDGQYVVIPYLVAIDNEVRIAFDRDSHDPKVIQWLNTKVRKFVGVRNVKTTNGIYIKTFKDIAEARKHMSQLVGAITFDEADLSRELGLLRDEIKELMAARKRPM